MSIANYIRSSRLTQDIFPSAVFAVTDGDEVIYKIRIVAPNISKDDIEVYQEGDYLVVQGSVKNDDSETLVVSSGNYPLNGSFKKVFNIKGGEISNVILDNGLLEITIKDTTIKRKKIEVQTKDQKLLHETTEDVKPKSRRR